MNDSAPPQGTGARGDPPPQPGRTGKSGRSLEEVRGAFETDFDIVRELGQGSVATVYLAREKALGRLVAIKVLLPGMAADETARRRFEREAKAAASLVHPNVVQVFRFGRLPDETPYLVMRYVKGRTMEERLKAEGTLPVTMVRQILREVASGLAAAHAQGIVHRDVRPANVLWDEDVGSAHLSDFGIAALVSAGGEEVTRLTQTGQMVGDPRYLSPEQLLDHELTTQADIYSLGILGYELYTGEGPYDARTNTQWISAHLTAEPRDLKRLRPDVGDAVSDLLRRCLNREPKHRPSAADAARILGSDGEGGTSGAGDPADLQQLIRRRVPQIVVVAAATGYGFLQLVELLFDNDSLAFFLALPFVACAVAAATVVAWFHGERGKQASSLLEWTLLSVLGVIWIAVSAWIFVVN